MNDVINYRNETPVEDSALISIEPPEKKVTTPTLEHTQLLNYIVDQKSDDQLNPKDQSEK
jgi:hypothetical protein